MEKTMVVLGGGGFVGRETVDQAIAAGWRVRAVVRSREAAATLQRAGAEVIIADASSPADWIHAAAGAQFVIDLIQPSALGRVGRRELAEMAKSRGNAAYAVTRALASLDAPQRPVYMTVSGTADLARDARGVVSDRSPLTSDPRGFAAIGLTVRDVVLSAHIDTTFVHLATVYGPGKTFASRIVPGLQRGRQPIFGRGTNRLPLVHVRDAARALVHLAEQPRAAVTGRSWIVADGGHATQAEFFRTTAELLGARAPRRLPEWAGRLIAGDGIIDELCKDVLADPSALLATGFQFLFPVLRDGVAASLRSMQLLAATN
ncbi:MAG: NAD-dependent epimerase/dehydratase family protein [bacterium]